MQQIRQQSTYGRSPSSSETMTLVASPLFSTETSTLVIASGEALSQPKTNPLHSSSVISATRAQPTDDSSSVISATRAQPTDDSSSVISATSAQPTDYGRSEDCFGDRGVCLRNPRKGFYITLGFVYCVSSLISIVVFFRLSTIPRKREDVLSAYNAASAAWPAAKKSFIDQVLDGFINVTGDGGSLLLLPYTDFTDNYPDTNGLNIPSSVFKFSALEVSSAPISDKKVYMNNQFVTLSINVSGVVSSVPLKIFSNDGYSDMPRAMIHTNCFVINMNTKKVSGGCNYDKDRRISYSAWKPVTNASGPYTFTGVRFSLRSDQDPFVVALRATDGSLTTSVERYSLGKIIVSTIIFLISMLALLSFCTFDKNYGDNDGCFCGGHGKLRGICLRDPQKGCCMTFGFIYCAPALFPGIFFTIDHKIQTDYIVGLFFLITSVCLFTCQCLVLSQEPPPPPPLLLRDDFKVRRGGGWVGGGGDGGGGGGGGEGGGGGGGGGG